MTMTEFLIFPLNTRYIKTSRLQISITATYRILFMVVPRNMGQESLLDKPNNLKYSGRFNGYCHSFWLLSGINFSLANSLFTFYNLS